MSQRQSKIGDGHVSKFLKSAWFLQAIALKPKPSLQLVYKSYLGRSIFANW